MQEIVEVLLGNLSLGYHFHFEQVPICAVLLSEFYFLLRYASALSRESLNHV
jgi:hypothetical protein